MTPDQEQRGTLFVAVNEAIADRPYDQAMDALAKVAGFQTAQLQCSWEEQIAAIGCIAQAMCKALDVARSVGTSDALVNVNEVGHG
jgi:hypothetical protein